MKKKKELSKNPMCTFMHKKASAMVELLVLLVVAVLSSAVVLLLVRGGVLEVKSTPAEYEQVLNAEFLPYGEAGYLAVKESKLCGFVDTSFRCFDEKNEFQRGEKVYLVFLVESSTAQGQVQVVRNYRLLDPAGRVLLQLDQRNSYQFVQQSEKDFESVAFADFFATAADNLPGEYVLEVIVENPLLEKKVILTERFVLR